MNGENSAFGARDTGVSLEEIGMWSFQSEPSSRGRSGGFAPPLAFHNENPRLIHLSGIIVVPVY